MFSDVHKHVTQRLNKSVIEHEPFPHIIVDNIFPKDFYQLLLKNEIHKEQLQSLRESNRVGKGYSGARYVLNLEEDMSMLNQNREFWQNFGKWLHYYFKDMLLRKFNQSTVDIEVDALYTKDYKTYSLGPHTDKITKVLTCLIYLPKDNSNSQYGTSIYVPKNPTFTCKGGPHHKREDFNLFKTVPFEPNKMFCFLKTDKSFHGVEPIDVEIERNLLIFDLQKTI